MLVRQFNTITGEEHEFKLKEGTRELRLPKGRYVILNNTSFLDSYLSIVDEYVILNTNGDKFTQNDLELYDNNKVRKEWVLEIKWYDYEKYEMDEPIKKLINKGYMKKEPSWEIDYGIEGNEIEERYLVIEISYTEDKELIEEGKNKLRKAVIKDIDCKVTQLLKTKEEIKDSII